MATIFFAWELGGGLGHLLRIAPLASGLADRGHRVFLASRDLWGLDALLSSSRVHYLPAPFRIDRPGQEVRPPNTFASILLNIAFGNDRGLAALTAAWQNLYRLTEPDVIIFDHSPTALLAARSFSARRIVAGTGFCVPPNTSPWPDLRSWLPPADRHHSSVDEAQLLTQINQLLRQWNLPSLAAACELYSDADDAFLTTFHELDHYPDRRGAQYWGPVNGTGSGGKEPVWPEAPGRKIFCYLKTFPALPQLLQALQRSRQPTLIFAEQIPKEVRKQFSSPTLRFESDRLDITKVADRCDLAITNGTFGTTATMLMAGKPLLTMPLALEQLILARRVAELGAGTFASVRDDTMIEDRLGTLLSSYDRFVASVSRLAANWSWFDPLEQQAKMLNRIEQLAGSR